MRRAAGHIDAGSRVFDIGCHQGEFANLLLGKSCDYSGIDPDAGFETDDVVRGRFPADVPEHWTSRPFDHAIALAVLEHVPTDELDEFLAAVAALLRPKGTFVATVPSPQTDRVLAVLHRVHLLDGMDLDAHDGRSVTDILAAAHRVGLRCDVHKHFQLGFNNLLVWSRS